MKPIETERLILIPLKADALESIILDFSAYEKQEGLSASRISQDPSLQANFKAACKECLNHYIEGSEFSWYTSWNIILKQENMIVGTFCFHGPPDSKGEVRVGYFYDHNYSSMEILPEFLKAAVLWAFTREEVRTVKTVAGIDAVSEKHRIERLGMRRKDETGEIVWWRRSE